MLDNFRKFTSSPLGYFYANFISIKDYMVLLL